MVKAVNNEAAKRVLIVVSSKSPYWQSAWSFSEDLIVVALELLQKRKLIPDAVQDRSMIKFLAKERWDPRIFIVFDIFHHSYDPDTAHLPGQNDLPVIAVFLGHKESASVAGPPMTNKVNIDIRDLHNATGLGSRPPFAVDHSNGNVPYYPNPRTSSP